MGVYLRCSDLIHIIVMYKISKIGILILYPTLNVLLPLFIFGTLGFQISQGGQVGSGLASSVLISSLLSLLLLVFIVFYIFHIIKNKTFSKQADGTRKAGVGDWFAVIFSALAIQSIVSNLIKLLA